MLKEFSKRCTSVFFKGIRALATLGTIGLAIYAAFKGQKTSGNEALNTMQVCSNVNSDFQNHTMYLHDSLFFNPSGECIDDLNQLMSIANSTQDWSPYRAVELQRRTRHGTRVTKKTEFYTNQNGKMVKDRSSNHKRDANTNEMHIPEDNNVFQAAYYQAGGNGLCETTSIKPKCK